jgi:hypothetical protein
MEKPPPLYSAPLPINAGSRFSIGPFVVASDNWTFWTFGLQIEANSSICSTNPQTFFGSVQFSADQRRLAGISGSSSSKPNATERYRTLFRESFCPASFCKIRPPQKRTKQNDFANRSVSTTLYQRLTTTPLHIVRFSGPTFSPTHSLTFIFFLGGFYLGDRLEDHHICMHVAVDYR